MISVNQMREAIKSVPRYAVSDAWQYKVDHMADRQVMAIYFRFVREGIICNT